MAAYGLLPWLVPTGWITARVEAQLSALMQRPVTVEQLEIGYNTGVVVKGLHIARRPGFGEGALLTARHIALPVSDRLLLPYDLLRMLWTGRSRPASSIEVDGLACWIVADEAGRLNIGDLNDQGGGVLPALAYDIADLKLHFIDSRHPETGPGVLQLPAFYCRLDPATGRMTWQGAGAFGSSDDSEAVNLAGELLVPRLQRAVALAGGSEIVWTDVLLTDFPAALLPANMVLLGGTSSGTLRIKATPQLDVLFDLTMDFADVRMARGENPPLGLAALGLELQGEWSGAGRSLRVDTIRCTAGEEWIIEGLASIPVLTLDDRPLSIGVRLQGRMIRSERLVEALVREGADFHGWSVRGPGRFDVDMRLDDGTWSGHLEVTADSAEVFEGAAVVGHAGVPKHLAVDVSRTVEGDLYVERARATCGGSTLDVEGRLWPFDPDARRWLAHLERGRVAVVTEEIDWLLKRSGLNVRVSGDMRVVVEAIRHERGLEILAHAELAAESIMSWPTWFEKSAGDSVQVRAAWLWPGSAVRRFDDVRFELASAGTRAAVSYGAFEVAEHATGPLVAIRAPFDVQGLAGLRRLVPAVDRVCDVTTVRGDCRGTLAANLAADGQQVRVHAEVDARAAEIDAREFTKSRHAPATFVADYHAGPVERSLHWSAELDGGRVEGHDTWASGTLPTAVELRADIASIGPFVAHWPRVAARLALLEVEGAARLTWQATADATGTEFRASGDFSETAIGLEEGELRKPAGRRLTLVGRGRIEGADAERYRLLVLDEVELRTPSSFASWTGQLRWAGAAESADVAVDTWAGSARFDWAVEDGLRFLADQREWGDLTWSGRVAGDIDVGYAGDARVADWVVDATDLDLRTQLFHKAAGADAALAGHVEGDALDVRLHAATISWSGPGSMLVDSIEELVGQYHAESDRWTLDTRGGVVGGLLTGRHVQGPVPQITYELSGASASEVAERYCQGAFPGLHPEGTITYRIGPPHDHDPGEVVARGELIVNGGWLSGKAAPSWMATVFPRLNLARFTFDRMHDWYVVHEDGRVQHQAIFQGHYYHLYVTGWQHGVGEVDYVIGIDLLAGQESPYWVEVGGGRIPLFRSVMHSDVDGNITEESVSYVPLRFVKALLWESNPLYTAYHALRKRALGRE